jgi:hypothetical protein
MCLVNDHKVPINLPDVNVLRPSEIVGTNNDFRLVERVEVTALDLLIKSPCFEDLGRQKELVGQFLIPLLAQIGRNNNKEFALSLGPLCESRMPASMVFPRPTSSARIAPFDNGERKAKSAASI